PVFLTGGPLSPQGHARTLFSVFRPKKNESNGRVCQTGDKTMSNKLVLFWNGVFCGALLLVGSFAAAEFPLLGLRHPQSAEDVKVLVQVQDRLGRYVSGLEKEQFILWEDKIEQKISFFQPVSFPSASVKIAYVIVFDVSGSSAASDELRQTI